MKIFMFFTLDFEASSVSLFPISLLFVNSWDIISNPSVLRIHARLFLISECKVFQRNCL